MPLLIIKEPACLTSVTNVAEGMSHSKLEKRVLVGAKVEEVWRAWTTVEGIRTFFAPDARVELELGGRYEILFDREAPEGSRGSEGCRILSYVPRRMLSFSWNAPPKFKKSRREIAQWVVLFFDPLEGDQTLVRLLEFGWKSNKEGERVYEYFDRAWTLVLARLAYSFSKGPLDWNRPYRPPGGSSSAKV